MKLLRILVFLCLAPAFIEAAKILFLIPVGPRSHQVFIQPITKELASRGHEVTIFSTNVGVTLDGPKNITHIKYKQKDNSIWEEINNQILKKNIGKPYKVLLNLIQKFNSDMCQEFIDADYTSQLMTAGKMYDVVVTTSVFNECGYPIASTVANSTVFLNFMRIFPHYAYFLNIPTPYSYVPIVLSQMTAQMTFLERLRNTVMSMNMLLRNMDYSSLDVIVNKRFPSSPTILETMRKSALVFTMGDPIVSIPSPKMPHVIEIGGLHCLPPKPLPKEFQEIVDSSGDHGFILFSLGTVVQKASQIPEVTKAFIAAFAQLKQTVIWKTREEIPGVSKNVKVVSWTSQQDLLGHPKIRLFITQAGIFGLQEAFYHGVPMIGMPFFADQFSNIARAVELGVGLSLDYPVNTPSIILSKITEILENPRYQENAKMYSRIFRDQLETPLDRAVYWLEYLVRHPEAKHLHNPSGELNIFQYHSLDVFGLILVLALVAIGVFVFLIKYICRRCSKPKRNIRIKKKS